MWPCSCTPGSLSQRNRYVWAHKNLYMGLLAAFCAGTRSWTAQTSAPWQGLCCHVLLESWNMECCAAVKRSKLLMWQLEQIGRKLCYMKKKSISYCVLWLSGEGHARLVWQLSHDGTLSNSCTNQLLWLNHMGAISKRMKSKWTLY